jgi:hypothetical protein
VNATDLGLSNQDLVVVGYGSLMSGSGLLEVRRGGKSGLKAKNAFPVLLGNARRGLAKPSNHGPYLAMDIEPAASEAPFRARVGLEPRAGEIGALGLVFGRTSAPAIASREGYRGDKLVELITLADRTGLSLGDFLLRISERADHQILAYRRALYRVLNYTSEHYIFHPVRFDEGFTAIIAVGSGFESSGAAEVISRRREWGVVRLLSLSEALDRCGRNAVDQPAQINYFVECLLGAWHGMDLTDLLGQVGFDTVPARELGRALNRAACDELANFLAATSLDEERYRERFSFGQPQFVSRLFDR